MDGTVEIRSSDHRRAQGGRVPARRKQAGPGGDGMAPAPSGQTAKPRNPGANGTGRVGRLPGPAVDYGTDLLVWLQS